MTGAQALQQLRDLLEKDDSAAPEFLQHNVTALKEALGSVYTSVEMHTLGFDFEQALAAIAAGPGPQSSVAPPS